MSGRSFLHLIIMDNDFSEDSFFLNNSDFEFETTQAARRKEDGGEIQSSLEIKLWNESTSPNRSLEGFVKISVEDQLPESQLFFMYKVTESSARTSQPTAQSRSFKRMSLKTNKVHPDFYHSESSQLLPEEPASRATVGGRESAGGEAPGEPVEVYSQVANPFSMQNSVTRKCLLLLPFRVSFRDPSKLFLSAKNSFTVLDLWGNSEEVSVQISHELHCALISNEFLKKNSSLKHPFELDLAEKPEILTHRVAFKMFHDFRASRSEELAKDRKANIPYRWCGLFPINLKTMISVHIDELALPARIPKANLIFCYKKVLLETFRFTYVTLVQTYTDKNSLKKTENELTGEFISLSRPGGNKIPENLEFIYKLPFHKVRNRDDLQSIEGSQFKIDYSIKVFLCREESESRTLICSFDISFYETPQNGVFAEHEQVNETYMNFKERFKNATEQETSIFLPFLKLKL